MSIRPLQIPLALVVVLLAGCDDGRKDVNLVCPAPVGTDYDQDGDLLTDVREAAIGTDPGRKDSDRDGIDDYVEVSAGTDPLDAESRPTGAVAALSVVDSDADLIGGPGAQGRVGDWLLQNDRIRAIVQSVDREQMQLTTYGGNLIDADVLREDGEEGNDIVGSITPLMSFQQTIRPERAILVNDGRDGGAAVLRVCGEDDAFEYMDLAATFKIFGFSTSYDSNPNFKIQMSTDYVLAPGSNVVEIVTTIGNEGKTITFPIGDVIDSGAAQEIYNTNRLGFGQASFATLLETQPPTKYMGFLAPGSGWGYVNDADPNVAVTISGVSVLLQGFGSAFGALGSHPENGAAPGLNVLKRGKRFSYHRGIVVTDGSGAVAPFNDEYQRRHDPTATLREGTVFDDAGSPLAGARIAFLSSSDEDDDDRNPVTTAESDAEGTYSAILPAGTYYVLAELPGREEPTYSTGSATVVTRNDQITHDAARVTLGTGTDLPDITFDEASYLNVSVTDVATGLGMPVRITVLGSDPSPPDTVFRDQKERSTGSIAAKVISLDGSETLALEPGSYTVYASKGLEWSIDSAPVTVVAEATTAATLSLGRVVDTTGWISADFHVHMVNSPDSPTPLADRALNGAADGLDVIVTTDHDYVTDLTPVVADLGLGSELATLPGDEITTWQTGHFISWPLTADATKVDGGAFKWAGEAGAVNQRTAKEIFESVEEAYAGTQVKQVCHPRGFKLQSYYSAVEVDMATLETKADSEFLRIPPVEGSSAGDSKLFFADFDTQEVQNGVDDTAEERWPDMNDLFTLFNHGKQIAGVGNSDTHSVFSGQLGYPRNYVKLADDAPTALVAQKEAFAQAVVAGKVIFTTGPFLDVQVVADTTGGPGDLVTSTGTTVQVQVDLRMPDWVEVDTLRFYSNTPDTAAPSDADGLETEPAAAAVMSDVDDELTVSYVNGKPLRTGTFLQSITVPAGSDAWIVVTASAEKAGTRSLFPIVPFGIDDASGVKPFAFANPVFLDGNGNQTYDAPGVRFTEAYRRPTVPPVRIYDARKGEIPEEPTPDIRAQFERLTRGMHHH